MKTIIAIGILLTGFTTCANAQTTPKADDLSKLKPFTGMDSLTWHMPKTPNALKQLPFDRFYNQPSVNLNSVLATASSNAIITYSTMPVKHVSGHYNMPNTQLLSADNKMQKQVIVINPLTKPAKP